MTWELCGDVFMHQSFHILHIFAKYIYIIRVTDTLVKIHQDHIVNF